jgi:hypothetical protein
MKSGGWRSILIASAATIFVLLFIGAPMLMMILQSTSDCELQPQSCGSSHDLDIVLALLAITLAGVFISVRKLAIFFSGQD